MKIIIGVDIGNATTEVALARITGNKTEFLASALNKTTGLKGTIENIEGVKYAINSALKKSNLDISDISAIKINEATPVIGDVSMETITETIITESTMIGHNPSTPGGVGLGIGETISLQDLFQGEKNKNYIVIVSEKISFLEAAYKINKATEDNYKITGAIIQKDEVLGGFGLLISNKDIQISE